MGVVSTMILAAYAVSSAPEQVTVTADLAAQGVPVSPALWGIFYEDINHSADGGLYAELLKNRNFEDGNLAPGCTRDGEYLVTPTGWRRTLKDSADPLTGWSTLAEGGAIAELTLSDAQPLNAMSTHCGKLVVSELKGGRAGLVNNGFWGVPAKDGETYTLSFFVRTASFTGRLTATLESDDGGKVYARAEFEPRADDWQRLETQVTCAGSDPRGRFVLEVDAPGTLWFDCVSLFPEKTWKGRENGLRPDIAEMLAALKPAFIRFPGGCIVEGFSMENAWNWKETLGDISERPGRHNLWGYRSSEGLGYHELLQFAEDLGAEPMLILNCGMSCQARRPVFVPMGELHAWVDWALDAIEYANGAADSEWGAARAANGHQAPFDLGLFGIGNENGGPEYHERYRVFYDAIKKRYPQMQIIACQPVPDAPEDVVDEHFYKSPEWFMGNSRLYDERDRNGPAIFVGEYAANRGAGKGNLKGALGEAGFMIGLERNADLIVMAAYAPLLQRAEDREWPVNLLVFDNESVYGTPSYYVQKLFSEHRATVTLPTECRAPETTSFADGACVGVGTWETASEYRDLAVESLEGSTLWEWDGKSLKGWSGHHGGAWLTQDGVMRQRSVGGHPLRLSPPMPGTDAGFVYRVKGRKLEGREGFIIPWRAKDGDNFVWWNIGGWGNTSHAVERSIDGSKGLMTDHVPAEIEPGRWYDIEIRVEGRKVQCRLDGQLVHEFEEGPVSRRSFEAGVGLDQGAGEYVVKLVNFHEAPREVAVSLLNSPAGRFEATTHVLTSGSPLDENSLGEPLKVTPSESSLGTVGSEFSYSCPAWSLCIVRLRPTE